MQNRGLLLFGPVFLLSYWACVVPHELGHAFVASLLGLRVFSICLGWVGQIVWRWRIFRTDICVTSLPSGGFTMLAPPSLFLIRLRWPLTVAAGTVDQSPFGVWRVSIPTHSETLELIIPPFVTANLALATLTLLPRQYATRLGVVASDGLALLTSPFASRALWKRRRGLYFTYEALERSSRRTIQPRARGHSRGCANIPTTIYFAAFWASPSRAPRISRRPGRHSSSASKRAAKICSSAPYA